MQLAEIWIAWGSTAYSSLPRPKAASFRQVEMHHGRLRRTAGVICRVAERRADRRSRRRSNYWFLDGARPRWSLHGTPFVRSFQMFRQKSKSL
jgi:hypothetical protein